MTAVTVASNTPDVVFLMEGATHSRRCLFGPPGSLGAMSHQRRTKIVATIGPACCTPEVIAQLLEAGMDGARLNMSHGSRDDHAQRARHVREAEESQGR